jgi:hypothetical protein
MEPQEFAARRRVEFERVDAELMPSTERALQRYAQGEADWWSELEDDASVLWLEHFQAEAPNADPDRFLARFRESVGESLAQTTPPTDPPDSVQVERVARWLGTYTVNDATWAGAGARGVRFKRWTTMHDSEVRETHVVADGQVQPIGARFNVGGYELRFPGDPVGPGDIYINCRCVVQPAAPRGEANVSPTTFAIEDDPDAVVPDEQMPVDELEDDEEEVTEIPVHGVLAPEGVPTGDGRQFGIESLTNRDLPLPIAYQLLSGEGHSGSATVGRLDEIFRDGNLMKFRGAIVLTKEHSADVIEGIIDGTVRGVSVDVDDVEVDVPTNDSGEMSGITVFSRARIAGVTIVPIPAFQEAFIALGHEFEDQRAEDEMSPEEALAACGCNGKGPEDDDNPDVELGYDAFRNYDTEARRRMAENGEAMPDGSFPIADEEDLRNAIQAIGRASDPAAARAHIKKRARALGMEALIPEGWSSDIINLDEVEREPAAALDIKDTYAVQKALTAAAMEMLSRPLDEFAPGTKDGPGWITHPIPTARIRRYWVHGPGAAKIRWGLGAPGGDFNRCRRQLAKYVRNPKWLAGLCANMHKEATGFWPGSRVNRAALLASAEPAPIFNLVASANYVFDANYFKKPEMETPRVGVEVEGDHVYGYIAQWGVCHIGISGVCTEAPPSKTDYWYYATGKVDTTEGVVRVGQITMDTGHAPLRSNAKVAAAHYDNTGAAAADVAVGEDEFGIWFSGVLRSKVTDEQRHALRASGRVSGDWRTIGGDLELVAALAVNVPGFPIPHVRAGVYNGEQVSLVAAGLTMEEGPSEETLVAFSAEDIAAIARTAVSEYRHQEKVAAKAAPIRQALRQKKIESLRSKIKEN